MKVSSRILAILPAVYHCQKFAIFVGTVESGILHSIPALKTLEVNCMACFLTLLLRMLLLYRTNVMFQHSVLDDKGFQFPTDANREALEIAEKLIV